MVLVWWASGVGIGADAVAGIGCVGLLGVGVHNDTDTHHCLQHLIVGN